LSRKQAAGGLTVLAMTVIVSASAFAEGAPLEIRTQVTPRDFTTLAAEISAKVEHVGAREGERFRKGQMLVTFDCSIQRAQLDEARAALGAAEKTVTVDRRLLELKTIGTLESDLAQAEADKARAKVAAGMAVTAKCIVPALLDVLDDSVLELEFVVPSQWLVWLKPGTKFQAVIDETGKTYPARLSRLGARIDPVSQTVKVMGQIDGSHPELSAGMSGRILLTPP